MGPTELNPPENRPRDLALLLLAVGDDPPRQRARDQQADRAGATLRRRVLDRLAAIDPEPDELVPTLEAIALELGDPTGPTRAVAAMFVRDWEDARSTPELWSWFVSEAIEANDRPAGRRRKGNRWPSTD